jgi:hypothetical protein
MQYKCKECGCEEFISQLNRYDIFTSEGNKIKYQSSELIDEEIKLFCRKCSNELKFIQDDIEI